MVYPLFMHCMIYVKWIFYAKLSSLTKTLEFNGISLYEFDKKAKVINCRNILIMFIWFKMISF